MSTTAAIRGKMGEYEYYQTTMKSKDVISKTSAAIDYFSPDDWEEMGEISRVQREPDFKRIMDEIAPYLIRSKKRFFNSIVVLLDEGSCEFQSLDSFPINNEGKTTTVSKLMLKAYQDKAEKLGFLEINDSKSMLILDGQHRMLSLKTVLNEQNKLRESFKKSDEDFDSYKNHGVPDDDISVIFLKVPNLQEMRKIFEDLNTYAKRQSKDVEIFGSESNPWYVLCQKYCMNKKLRKDFLKTFVQKKGTSLGPRNYKMTTAAHLVSIIKFLTSKMKFKKQMQLDEAKVAEKMSIAESLCNKEINEFFENINIFKKVLNEADATNIPDYRDPSSKDALLLKPMPQVALFKAIYFLKNNSDMELSAIYRNANKIDFSYEEKGNQWKNIVIDADNNIQTSGKAEDRLTRMLVYFIAGKPKCEKLENGEEWLETLLNDYKEVFENGDDISELPAPVTR